MQKTNFKTIKQNSFSKVIEEDVFYWKAKKLMKRVDNLLEQIISIENLNEAVDAFLDTKNKTKRSIKRVAENREKIINELIEDIKNETFKPSKFNEFTVKEGKKVRLIQSLPYYDRIALNAIMRVCGEVLYKTLIRDSYASIKGKGLHDGLKRVVKALEDGENTVYCLKLDIHHFYPSVNQEILISLIKKKIKDKKVIDLLIRIIRSFKEGLPIGYHSSQYFGNFYLSYLDHFIKETLHVKYYFRYCDDIVILDSNKEKLKHIYCEIKEYVTTYLKLTIKKNAQIFPVESRGIDFLGYVIRHDYIRLRKTIKVKALKHLKKVKSEKRLKSILGAFYGWAKHSNYIHLFETTIRNEA